MDSVDLVVVARDATYARKGYRSYEFASFEALPGQVTALLSSEHGPVRDLLLTVAGLVRPTSGSLSVLGCELAARCRLGARDASLGRVRLGVVTGLADVADVLTVEEAVSREASLAGPSDADGDVLEYLARFRIATHAGERISQLGPKSRACLSAALALCGSPRAAAVDLADAFVSGLSASDAAAVVSELGPVADELGCAVIVGTTEPACARAAGAAYALDMRSAEELERGEGTRI